MCENSAKFLGETEPAAEAKQYSDDRKRRRSLIFHIANRPDVIRTVTVNDVVENFDAKQLSRFG